MVCLKLLNNLNNYIEKSSGDDKIIMQAINVIGKGLVSITSEPTVEEDPVEEDPVEEDPVEEPPGEEDPVEEPPVEENPVEEPPVEENPVEEPPVEEEPVEEDPVEEDPVEEEPVEEDPVEEDPIEVKAVSSENIIRDINLAIDQVLKEYEGLRTGAGLYKVLLSLKIPFFVES